MKLTTNKFRYAPVFLGRRAGLPVRVLAAAPSSEPVLKTAEIVGMGGGLAVAIIGAVIEENVVLAIGSSLFAAGLFSLIVRHFSPSK